MDYMANKKENGREGGYRGAWSSDWKLRALGPLEGGLRRQRQKRGGGQHHDIGFAKSRDGSGHPNIVTLPAADGALALSLCKVQGVGQKSASGSERRTVFSAHS